jgi:hypothetical protein
VQMPAGFIILIDTETVKHCATLYKVNDNKLQLYINQIKHKYYDRQLTDRELLTELRHEPPSPDMIKAIQAVMQDVLENVSK